MCFLAQGSVEKLRIKEIEDDLHEIRSFVCELKLENRKIKAENKVMVNDIKRLSNLVMYHNITPAKKCETYSHRKYEPIEHRRTLHSFESNCILYTFDLKKLRWVKKTML